MFRRILIANRGEIAVRVIHACRELGCASTAVYSDADADAPHVRAADCAARLGPPEAGESYLNVDAVLAAARELDCDALHPGYGFLAENADFAQAVADAGLAWIGPPPEAMRKMGLKTSAREVARAAGAPVVPGYDSPGAYDSVLSLAADELGYPVMVKASAGGGGKGMRLVAAAAQFEAALAAAKREAQAAFGNPAVYLEKFIARPRHIEVQVLADAHGNCVSLGERECSIQRRHQKLVEETPSTAVGPELRARLGELAVRIAREVGYVGAGTLEFMLAPDGQVYFLEMNTRLQVEHGVTELAYGIDLVQWQIRIAAGEPVVVAPARPSSTSIGTESSPPSIGLTREATSKASGSAGEGRAGATTTPRGRSIEVRICAEDPAQGFLPQTGRIGLLRLPSAPGVRVDHALREGLEVSPYYDPMLAKLLVWAETRDGAIARMSVALRELRILGVATNISFLQDVIAHPAFAAGKLHTGFIAEHLADWKQTDPDDAALAAAGLALAERGSSDPPARMKQSVDGLPQPLWAAQSGWRNT